MKDFNELLFNIILGSFFFCLIYVLLKLGKSIDIFIEVYKSKKVEVKPIQSSNVFHDMPVGKQSSVNVGLLSPEILAPALKRPPRSPGGFGSKIQDT
jgi:hypothetical protein